MLLCKQTLDLNAVYIKKFSGYQAQAVWCSCKFLPPPKISFSDYQNVTNDTIVVDFFLTTAEVVCLSLCLIFGNFILVLEGSEAVVPSVHLSVSSLFLSGNS